MNAPQQDELLERQRLVQAIKTLPPAPFILNRILECIEDPKTCAADLKEVILQDQALTVKTLSFANSAYFGFPQQITEVTRAIVTVGFETIMEFALGLSMIGHIGEVKAGSELNSKEFWKYSLASAEASKIVAGHLDYGYPEQAYIMGLVHDIGKLVLLQCFKSEYEDILFNCRAEQGLLIEMEQKALHLDHALAGQWLAEKWNLPDELIAAVSLHHRLDTLPPEHRETVALVHMAEYLVRTARIGSNGDMDTPALHPAIKSFLASQKVDPSKLRTQFERERPKLEAIFSAIL